MISIINWVRAYFDFSLLCYLSYMYVSLFCQLNDYTSYRKTTQATGLSIFFKISLFIPLLFLNFGFDYSLVRRILYISKQSSIMRDGPYGKCPSI